MVFCILLWFSGQKHAFFYKSITTTCCKYLKFNIMCRYLKEKSTLNISFLKNKIANECCVPFYSCAKWPSLVSPVTWGEKGLPYQETINLCFIENISAKKKKGTNPKQTFLHFIFHTNRISGTNDHLRKKI